MNNPLIYYIYPLYILIILLLALFIFYKCIYTPHIVKSAPLSFTEMLAALNATINTEIDIYEKNIFSTKGAITNANFDNFYNDITKSILDALSPSYYYHMSVYLKDTAVATIVCRKVKEYLSGKITGSI